jgi:hypothetical protein
MQQLFSGFFKLNNRDFVNGLVMAVLGALFGSIYPTIQNWLTSANWDLLFDWHIVIKSAISGAATYIIKNLLTDKNGNFLGTKQSIDNPISIAPNDSEQQNLKS